MKDKYARQKKYAKEKLKRIPLDEKPGIYNQFRQVCEDNGTLPTTEMRKFIRKFTEENRMKKYFIDFNTGAGNEWADTLEEAFVLAENGLSYTQEPVCVYNGAELIAKLPWYGIEPSKDDVATANFGDSGFYGEWIKY